MSPDQSRAAVHVVAGVVIDAANRVLIAQRPKGTHLAGGWEFPGGKLEPGEERVAGLARELREEIDILIGLPRPLMRVRHTYPIRDVLLDVWVVRRYRGEPRGLDGQSLRWCTQEELATAELLPADRPIVAALRLPERLTQISTAHYVVGGADEGKLRGVCCSNATEAAGAASAGADFLVMRGELQREQLTSLCESVPVPVFARNIPLETAWSLGASGISDITD